MADREAERTSLDQYERYMKREPLNDELRAVQRGETLLVEPAHPVDKAVAAVEREKRPGLLDWQPSRAQLADLKEMVASEGWPVLMRLLEKRLEIARETAITLSQNHPLENQVGIAHAWTYHGIMKRVVTEMEPAVKQQVDRLLKAE